MSVRAGSLILTSVLPLWGAFRVSTAFEPFTSNCGLDLTVKVGVVGVHRVTEHDVGIVSRNYVDITVTDAKFDLSGRQETPALGVGLGVFVVPPAERNKS